MKRANMDTACKCLAYTSWSAASPADRDQQINSGRETLNPCCIDCMHDDYLYTYLWRRNNLPARIIYGLQLWPKMTFQLQTIDVSQIKEMGDEEPLSNGWCLKLQMSKGEKVIRRGGTTVIKSPSIPSSNRLLLPYSLEIRPLSTLRRRFYFINSNFRRPKKSMTWFLWPVIISREYGIYIVIHAVNENSIVLWRMIGLRRTRLEFLLTIRWQRGLHSAHTLSSRHM